MSGCISETLRNLILISSGEGEDARVGREIIRRSGVVWVRDMAAFRSEIVVTRHK